MNKRLFLLSACVGLAYAGWSIQITDVIRWLETPIDLNSDGKIDHQDVFILASQYNEAGSLFPVPTPTPDPRQANLPRIGEPNEITITGDTTLVSMEFPTGREAYLMIVRNGSNSGSSEVAVDDPDQGDGFLLAKTTNKEPRQASMAPKPSMDCLVSLPDDAVIAWPNAKQLVPQQALSVGQTRSFDLYGGGKVNATLRYVGAKGAIYVDDAIWGQADSQLDQDLIDQEGAFFDAKTYPTISMLYGEPGDVNNDGHIAILLTPKAVQQDGKGFFFGGDLFRRNELAPQFPTNSMEILYVAPPGVNDVKPEDIKTIIAHEMQHLINFYYHSLIFGNRNGLNDEERWLDEGLAHLAEDFVDQPLAGSNKNNAANYFNATNSVSLIEDRYVPTGTQRGGAYLLCRYLTDRFGTGILAKMAKTGAKGIANMEAAIGIPFTQAARDWSRALFLSDLNISADPILNYSSFLPVVNQPARWWGKPFLVEHDLSNLQFFGSLYYAFTSPHGFGYVVFKSKDEPAQTVEVNALSGVKPSVDLIRLPDQFHFPEYLNAGHFKTVVLDSPMPKNYALNESVTITGQTADGADLTAFRVVAKTATFGFATQRDMDVSFNGNRFSFTLLFENPGDVGLWRILVLPNGASSSIAGDVVVRE